MEFPTSFILDQNTINVLKMTHRLNDLFWEISNLMDGSFPVVGSSTKADKVRYEFLTQASSLATVPKVIWKKSVIMKFKPYWLIQEIVFKQNLDLFETYLESNGKKLCYEAIIIDQEIRDCL